MTDEHLRTVGHTGSQGGFLAYDMNVPDKGIFIVLLLNTRRDMNAFVAEVYRRLRAANWLDEPTHPVGRY